ncbi:dTDP-4-dehydrorhamnose 3,5-epimerase [Hyphomonas oceanitis]|uniref:dTDP-4-dehydrorhamnose 3,5-epimerase n=1 Tax=Hyphomonas oceanitis SCH89 TaxID=1280953 RepID=A0A059G548_9PROT|nr:dTDP-4-dehydrorhamnose 3,5-epimerase [Hyphomonas oceanitis]KDA01916.1 dTDP-4-dehydrorhamnose 3,5-epimerase [Hyphomonas oceanitis SCH89]
MKPEFRPDPVLKDVILIKPARIGDARGWFSETFNARHYAEAGIPDDFVQDNESCSEAMGTLRGLHFQLPPHAQAKLVRCTRGRILDVVVDIRQGSPTFGQHTRVELSAEKGEQVYVPVGFAHGFCTLEPDCEISYKVTAYYAPAFDRGLAFDDPSLGIQWPFPDQSLVLSNRDRGHPRLSDLGDVFPAETAGAAR